MTHHQAIELLSTALEKIKAFCHDQSAVKHADTALSLVAMARRATAPASEPAADRDAVLEQAYLPPLPEHIEVGGEGWGWEDFCSEKTFSVEHMKDFGRACIANERKRLASAAPAAQEVPAVPSRSLGLLKEALAWIENSAEPAPSLCADIRKEIGPAAPPSPSVDQAKRLVGGEVAGPVPDVLFDGMAVYEEITRMVGKGHCISAEAVSATLDAVVRMIRSDRASTGSATSTDGGEGGA